MSKFRGFQIADQAISTRHIAPNTVVNSVLLSNLVQGSSGVTLGVSGSVTLVNSKGSPVTLDLGTGGTLADSAFLPSTTFLWTSGGTVTGNLTVNGNVNLADHAIDVTTSGVVVGVDTTFNGDTIYVSGSSLTMEAYSALDIASGAHFSISGASVVTEVEILQALGGIGSTVTAENLNTLTDGGDASTLHSHSSQNLSIKTTHRLGKRATTDNDNITLDYGTPSSLQIGSGTGPYFSDIDVYLNGQLLEMLTSGLFQPSPTWSFSIANGSGTVAFNNSVSGDFLYVCWDAV